MSETLGMASTDSASAAAALARGLAPASVAVIGAGRSGGVGAEILANLVATFTGRIVPVNPNAEAIGALRCYATVASVPDAVDLAVIAVPATRVDAAIDDCIQARVPMAVIIGAGFSESGAEGRAREAALVRRARRGGLRIIGPNCLGVINTDPAHRLNASFAGSVPPAGPIALASQSGALGLAVLGGAGGPAVGVSSFVSTGNSADVSFVDLLEYWEADPRTRAILLYAESLPEPRRLAAVARRVARRTPIVALKAGRSPAGARAAASHTGALACRDDIVDAWFRDAGILRAPTLEDLLATGLLLASQPLPRGTRAAILTNAGGPAILAADACSGAGLQVAALSAHTVAALRAFLPPQASVTDPVDMIATAQPEDYARAIPLLLADAGVDALIVMAIPLRGTDAVDVARAVAAAACGTDKPVLATFFGATGVAPVIAPVPCYQFPETAVRALGAAAAHAAWRRQPDDASAASDGVDAARARDIIGRQRDRRGWMETMAVASLLGACGIDAAPTRTVVSRHDAVTAAREIGYPVVLKGTGARLVHKTESKAVITGLADETALLRAFNDLGGRADVERVIIQPMVTGGVEMFVGAIRDDAFGPVVVCGTGGILVELLDDVSRRLAPVGPRAAAAMLDEIRGSRRLRGFRGGPPLDEHAFIDVILRVSALIDACPGIAEIDLNPVIVQARGAVVVDARIRLQEAN